MGNISIGTSVSTWPENMTSSLIHSWASRQDSYSGDWNTCSSINRRIKVADKYTESAKKKAYKLIEEEDLPNRSCNVYDLGVDHYEVWSVVSEKVTKVKPSYKEMFVLYGHDGEFATAETLTEAKTKATKAILTGKETYYQISIKKKKVLVGGTESVALLKPMVKTYKSKPKSVKAGAVLREIHRYYVSGMAKD